MSAETEHKQEGHSYVTHNHLAEVFGKFTDKLENQFRELRKEIKGVERQTQPNYATFWAGAGVVLLLVSLLCGAMFYYFNTRFVLQDQARAENYMQVNTRVELIENERSKKAERYDDLVEEMVKERLNNGTSKQITQGP